MLRLEKQAEHTKMKSLLKQRILQRKINVVITDKTMPTSVSAFLDDINQNIDAEFLLTNAQIEATMNIIRNNQNEV